MISNATLFSSSTSIAALVERHVGDAAFYWKQHDKSSHSPLLTLSDLRAFNRLLNAHLDGIEVAKTQGIHAALSALQRWRGAGEMFVCVYLVVRSPPKDIAELWTKVSNVLETDPQRMLRGAISALLWAPKARAGRWVEHLSAPNQSLVWQIVAWRAIARNHEFLREGEVNETEWRRRFEAALSSTSSHLRAAAVRAAASLDRVSRLDSMLQDCDTAVAVEAAIALLQHREERLDSSLRLLWRAVWHRIEILPTFTGVFRAIAEHQLERWLRHLALAIPVGHSDVVRLVDLLPPRLRLAFVLHHGDGQLISWVRGQLDNPDCARLAGWTWSAMTGVSLEEHSLVFDPALFNAYKSVLTDELDPGLLMPDPDAIERYSLALEPIGLQILGKPFSIPVLVDVLWQAPQCLRWIAAQRLRLFDVEMSRFDLDTRASFQQQWQRLSELFNRLQVGDHQVG